MFLDPMGEMKMVSEDEPGDCHPRYWAAYMRETNLMLVVMENQYVKYDENCSIPPDTTPTATSNSTTSREPCHKLDLAGLTRRRLEGCFTYHDEVNVVNFCRSRHTAKHFGIQLFENTLYTEYDKVILKVRPPTYR